MKKIQITSLAVFDYGENKDSIKFKDWIMEFSNKREADKYLNEIRYILKKTFQAKYKSNVQIHLNSKEL